MSCRFVKKNLFSNGRFRRRKHFSLFVVYCVSVVSQLISLPCYQSRDSARILRTCRSIGVHNINYNILMWGKSGFGRSQHHSSIQSRISIENSVVLFTKMTVRYAVSAQAQFIQGVSMTAQKLRIRTRKTQIRVQKQKTWTESMSFVFVLLYL